MAMAMMIVGAVSSISSATPPIHTHTDTHTHPHSQCRFPTSQFLILLPSGPGRLPRGRKSVVKSGSSRPDNNNDSSKRATFLDEEGVVNDMDGYLNYLSLEYDSVWDTKPSWCQPWTITLTGVLVTAGSWLALHSAPVTAVVLFLICAWWYIFLYSYPKAYSDMIAERRNKVKNGAEDTYGLGKTR